MSNRSKFASFLLFLIMIASVATNIYLIRTTLDLQTELAQTSQQAVQASEQAAQASEQAVQALAMLEETSNKANKALTTASDVKSQIDSSAAMIGIAIDYVAEQLEGIEEQEFTVVVPIDQEIPIDTTIAFEQQVNIPFKNNIPINTTVNVPIELPFVGALDLDIPINTTIPVELDINVPLSQDIPIQTTVPVKLDFPITISLKDTEIGEQLSQWREALNQVKALQDSAQADQSEE